MDYESFKHYMLGLGENGKILIADYQGVVQSYMVFAFSNYSAYAVYAGNITNQLKGSTKLLIWESILFFKQMGVCRYDFVGVRSDPEKGSKQEALALWKKRFGATLTGGYMWKYSFHPFKYLLYSLAARVRSGGDIVDQECHKLIVEQVPCRESLE
jgi:lipid II:glycine glycyltransferase (peptidoglycan interpeptide bridge formation enzyme)